MTTRILVGDVRTRLASLPSGSVNCVVTSPPYFGLRDYGCDGQIGLESTPDEFITELVGVFREVRRVLADDGTCWVNMGDSYSNQGKWGGATGGKASKGNHGTNGSRDRREYGLPFKQRLMIPARLALAMQADGWWLRDEIIWQKPNPMPVSVTDRTTPAHEMLYMFSKSARYYYDMDAVKEPAICGSKGSEFHTGKTGERQLGRAQKIRPSKPKGSFNGKTEAMVATGQNAFRAVVEMRQPRSVWSIPTRPFKGAHFATFPPELPRRCILAGCPAGGVVLDPFSGAGTTAMVAIELRRQAIGIELNPAYALMSLVRLAGV